MDPNFWREKWAKGEIAFHQREANPLLVEHMARLELPPGSRVFLPLCGKTRDIAWLLSQGYRVCGAELVQTAVEQLFDELGMAPVMRERYAAHLTELTGAAPQLLLTFVYDQSLMRGPPFSVSGDEVRRHYGNRHAITLLASHEVGGL